MKIGKNTRTFPLKLSPLGKHDFLGGQSRPFDDPCGEYDHCLTKLQLGFYDNATINEPVSNLGLLATYTPSNLLDVSFSFMIPANYGNNSQQFFNLGYISSNGQTVETAIPFYLGPNFQATTSMMGYRTSGGDRVNLGGNFTPGEQVNLSFTNINRTEGTCNVSWTTSDGGSGSQAGIALTGTTSQDWNFISFGESSGVLIACLRQRSSVLSPVSASRRMRMICSVVRLVFFMRFSFP